METNSTAKQYTDITHNLKAFVWHVENAKMATLPTIDQIISKERPTIIAMNMIMYNLGLFLLIFLHSKANTIIISTGILTDPYTIFHIFKDKNLLSHVYELESTAADIIAMSDAEKEIAYKIIKMIFAMRYLQSVFILFKEKLVFSEKLQKN